MPLPRGEINISPDQKSVNLAPDLSKKEWYPVTLHCPHFLQLDKQRGVKRGQTGFVCCAKQISLPSSTTSYNQWRLRLPEVFAVKVEFNPREDCREAQNLEILFESRNISPYVVQYFHTEPSEQRFWMIFEYIANGFSLKDIENQTQLIQVQEVKGVQHFSYQLVCGLNWIHGHTILHCDISARNILVLFSESAFFKWEGLEGKKVENESRRAVFALLHPRFVTLKIADFGNSWSIQEAKAYSRKGSKYLEWMLKFISGPRLYWAIERYEPVGAPNINKISILPDMWLLGCCIASFVSRRLFFPSKYQDIYNKSKNLSETEKFDLWSTFMESGWSQANGHKNQVTNIKNFLSKYPNIRNLPPCFFPKRVFSIYDDLFFSFISSLICKENTRKNTSQLADLPWIKNIECTRYKGEDGMMRCDCFAN